jgi:hypothetical protein
VLAARIQNSYYLLREAIGLCTLARINYPISVDIKIRDSLLYSRLTNEAHTAAARIVLDIASLLADFFLSSDGSSQRQTLFYKVASESNTYRSSADSLTLANTFRDGFGRSFQRHRNRQEWQGG